MYDISHITKATGTEATGTVSRGFPVVYPILCKTGSICPMPVWRISAFSSETRLVLGQQLACEEKSKERIGQQLS